MRDDGSKELFKHVDSKFQLVINDVRKRDMRVEFPRMDEMVAVEVTENASVPTFLPLWVLLGME